MKNGDIVKLARWTKFPDKYGLIINFELFDGDTNQAPEDEEILNVKVLVEQKIYDFHPHDFYVT
jgi:hypothetical protein